MDTYSLATRAVHAGQEPEKWSSFAVVPPISLATTFQQPYPAKPVVCIFIFIFKNHFKKYMPLNI